MPLSDLLNKRSEKLSVRLHEREDQHRSVILAVGEIGLWRETGRLLHGTSDLAYSEFSELCPELFETIAPDVVLSPMVTRSFDCLDLAQFLHSIDFYGRYRIVSQAMPNPRLILSEIAALCPGLDVDLIILDTLPTESRYQKSSVRH